MNTKSNKIFKTPFKREYWQLAMQESNFVKTITLVAIFIAMSIGLETLGTVFPIIIFTRKVFLSFLPIALSSMLFGPIIALGFGFIADILGFLMQGGIAGPFFPGYTLNAILAAFIYAIFFYRTNITVLKIFLAKLIVNIFVNVILGSLWLSVLYGKKTYWLYLTGGLIKNLVLIPLEVVLLVILFKKIIPISKTFNLLSPEVSDEVKLF